MLEQSDMLRNMAQALKRVLIIGETVKEKKKKAQLAHWLCGSVCYMQTAPCLCACETFGTLRLSASLFCPCESRKYQFRRVHQICFLKEPRLVM